MPGPRVFEFAKDLGLETLALMNKLRDWNIPVKNHMAELDESTITVIRQKFESEVSAQTADKKKAAKKKAAADEGEGAGPKKKVATKAAPKAGLKAAATKAAAKAPLKAGADTTAVEKKGSTVIRRKASEMAESREAATEASAPVVEVVAAPAPVKEIPHEIQHPEEVADVVAMPAAVPAETEAPAEVVAAGAPTAAPTAVAAPVAAAPVPEAPNTPRRIPGKREVVMDPAGDRGRNIVGRMDLSRAMGPNRYGQGPSSGGPSPSSGPPRPRSNIRTGFVTQAAPAFTPPPTDFGRKDDRRRRPMTPGAPTEPTVVGPEGLTKGEEVVPTFSAAEFRKREMIFQPKKKKGLLNRESLKTQITKPKASKRVIKIHDKVQVADFANAMGLKAGALITHLVKNGMMVTQNDSLDFETAALTAPEFGFEVENVKKSVTQLVQAGAFGDLEAANIKRAPIVTVMGHVDHGKTSLLDAIRKTDVAAGEAGGITQHIGAYSVQLEDGHTVTFLDTPGHAAFTAMRARGANVTDIAVIVVAADDGLMPQTAEAINHAKAAGVPIIVAINKMDKPGVNPEKIKQQLTEFELVPEEWGGSTIYCPVSALKRTGVKELLDQIILLSEVSDLKANPMRSGTGVVIEARMERGRGVVATLLVKDGTVRQGQAIVAGNTFGRVRAMMDYHGKQVKEAGPSVPVEILGLQSTPSAGDKFDICESDKQAEEVAQVRKTDTEKKSAAPSSKMSLEDLFSKVSTGDVKELPIVLKTDVAGSAEAIVGMLSKEISDKVKIKIVHTAVGGINESDVLLGSTAKGIVIGFNVRPDSGALALAKREGVEIKTYSIIYELMDDMKKALEGLLEPDVVERVLGHADVRNVFTVPKIGAIAGCFVQDGKVIRSAQIRVLREGRIIYDGKIGSLKRFKDDAREVATGFECGVSVENFNDVKVGDTFEIYEKELIQKTL